MLRDYLHLDETLAEISVTPNRGDAMSVLGVARELAAASGKALRAATGAGNARRASVPYDSLSRAAHAQAWAARDLPVA